MTDITSFNQVFVEAARAGLLLQTFHQTPDGRFVASWRRESGPGATHYPTAEHERPFDALLAAFQAAVGAALEQEAHMDCYQYGKIETPTVEDLFG